MLSNETARRAGGGPSTQRLYRVAADLWRFLFATRLRTVLAAWMSVWIFLEIFNLFYGNAHDKVMACSLFICAGSTLAILAYRDVLTAWARRWSAPPRLKFLAIGSAGAAFAEYVFWQVERMFGTTGIAANPNFALDLLATMPWYMMMILLLWKVETRYNYSLAEIFFLGGVYDFGADGLVGSIMGGTFTVVTVPALFVLIPFFALIYAVMVLPCSAILKGDIDRTREQGKAVKGNRYVYSMLPWLGLIPYFILAFATRMV